MQSLVPNIRKHLDYFGQNNFERQYSQQLFAKYHKFVLKVYLTVGLVTQLLVFAKTKQSIQDKDPKVMTLQYLLRVLLAHFDYFPVTILIKLDVWGEFRDPIFVEFIRLYAVSRRDNLLVFYSPKNFALLHPTVFQIIVLSVNVVLVVVKFLF